MIRKLSSGGYRLYSRKKDAKGKRKNLGTFKSLAAAQKLADFAVTKAAYEMYGKYYAIVGYPGLNPAPPNYPPSADAAMVTG